MYDWKIGRGTNSGEKAGISTRAGTFSSLNKMCHTKMHESSGTCAGVYTCYCLNQLKKTTFLSIQIFKILHVASVVIIHSFCEGYISHPKQTSEKLSPVTFMANPPLLPPLQKNSGVNIYRLYFRVLTTIGCQVSGAQCLYLYTYIYTCYIYIYIYIYI